MSKRCYKCARWLSKEEFFADRSRKDGLKAYCKDCGRDYQRKYPLGEGPRIGGLKRRTPYNDDGMKRCSTCHQWLLSEQFGPRKDAWDGRRSKCRTCENEARRAKCVHKGRPSQRGRYQMSVTGSAAISRSVSARMRGEGNPNWKGGNKNWRGTPEIMWWRRQVFERDHYTCQVCGDTSGSNLNAHHVLTAKEHPNLIIDVSNGITLCNTCHSAIHGTPVVTSRYKDTETVICACGCGAVIKRWASRKSTRPRRYLPGHSLRRRKSES